MSANFKPFNVAVVGGGIGGLSLAIGLLKHKVNFHIYEGALAFSEIGAGVGFGPNARQAMSLIDPRIKQGYDKHETTSCHEDAKEHFFQFRMGMDGKNGTEGLQAGDTISKPGGPGKGMNMIHRARFLDELVALIPDGSASFGKRLVSVQPTDDGVRLYFSDGNVAGASAVIGCDGVKSRVRRSLFGRTSDARFTGKYAYRGLVPMSKAVGLLGEARARNAQGYLGYGGHVLTMQVERGTVMNVVAFRTKLDGKWEDPQWVLPMRKDEMNRDFADWSDDVKKILKLMEKPDVWALFDHPPIPQLWEGRICLLGDAAHASTPHQGSGAGMALEDAYILSELLGQVQCADELEIALEAYNHVRHARTMKLVETSRMCGDVYEFLGPDTGDDVRKIDQDLRTRYDWIWDADVADQLTDAIDILQTLRKEDTKDMNTDPTSRAQQ